MLLLAEREIVLSRGSRQVSWPHLSSRILAPGWLVGCGLEEGFAVVAAQEEGEAVQVGA